jgi:hypothetical protein
VPEPKRKTEVKKVSVSIAASMMEALKLHHAQDGTEAAVISFVESRRGPEHKRVGKKVIMSEMVSTLEMYDKKGVDLSGRRQELVQRVFDVCKLTPSDMVAVADVDDVDDVDAGSDDGSVDEPSSGGGGSVRHAPVQPAQPPPPPPLEQMRANAKQAQVDAETAFLTTDSDDTVEAARQVAAEAMAAESSRRRLRIAKSRLRNSWFGLMLHRRLLSKQSLTG